MQVQIFPLGYLRALRGRNARGLQSEGAEVQMAERPNQESNGDLSHATQQVKQLLDEEYGGDGSMQTEVTDDDIMRWKEQQQQRSSNASAQNTIRALCVQLNGASTPCLVCFVLLSAALVASALAFAFVSREHAMQAAHNAVASLGH